jgi:ATP-dependent Lon protease
MKKPTSLVSSSSGNTGINCIAKNGSQSFTKQEKIEAIIQQMREMTPTQVIQWMEETINANIPIYRELASLENVYTQTREIHCDLENITKTLDESIYGHRHAKNQILKIIAQWMNGEQSGYCFGFEGSPGVGKTSLAKKGLAYCLKDDQGNARPFSFIAIGGSSNGSTLEGHSYTYVNSTYGRIAEILMESKCMNPIIYVDELDKVSKTEHGKEIIGILTHLIDPTQNSGFQDKYFSGIDLDLSKALFVFSYNDPQSIDKILLDRIHRIKFDNLTIEEKIVIVRKHIIPEINKKMGMVDTVMLSDEMIVYLIEKYTLEPGVRKLKEVLFDLFGEINIEMLKYEHCHCDKPIELPIIITIENIEKKYLSKYTKVNEKIVHNTPEVGVINGLWANAYGNGGIIPIQTMFYPTTTFLELKLTGMQGDVMKESMNVAKSLAWNLLPEKKQEELVKLFERTKCQGLHIHCPEGAVSKDGPSAGAAITLAVLSLFLGKPVLNTVAITGEINLQGNVTEIGGLEHKIAGGVRAGIRKFLFPRENKKDFEKFRMKMGELWKYDSIEFVEVGTIFETFQHFFTDSIDIVGRN